jgi:hypothetical protein
MGDQIPPGTHPPAESDGSLRANLTKAWLTLNGIATPEGAHPTGRHVSVLRTKIWGVVFALGGLATAYYFILRPIEEAKRTGVLHQGPFGLVMPIVLLYGGLATLVTDLRDEKTMRAGPEGRLWWTRKGRIFQYGMWGSAALTLISWYFYVRSMGISPLKCFLDSVR